jgi:protein gp37
MSEKTAIQWTDATWNPVVGCSIVSPGCTNCYAMKMAGRLEAMGSPIYAGHTMKTKAGDVWNGKVSPSNWGQVIEPLSWRAPRRIFVNSMSDLFHDGVADAIIDTVFAVMALCRRHTFQILTKRPERMRAYLAVGEEALSWRWLRAAGDVLGRDEGGAVIEGAWPLPNVWLGTSVEDQARADERIPHLLATPAAVRFLSCEPLLGPIDLYNGDPDPRLGGLSATATYLGDWWPAGAPKDAPSNHGVDWVIVGGESGPNARPMHPDWVRSLRDQCAAAEVPFFFKQWGEWVETKWQHCSHPVAAGQIGTGFQNTPVAGYGLDHPSFGLDRVGKKRAGRALDGIEHNSFPHPELVEGKA